MHPKTHPEEFTTELRIDNVAVMSSIGMPATGYMKKMARRAGCYLFTRKRLPTD